MKKALIGLMAAVVLLAVFFAVDGDRWIKNSIGDFLGYARCSCGDSFWWKDCGSIKYSVLKEGKDYTVTGNIEGLKIVSEKWEAGVLICKECLANPAKLNKEKIAQDLLNIDWPPEEVELVKQAVIRYKKENK